jgi:hypothetical protein
MNTAMEDLDLKRYARLLARAVPKIVKTEEENERALAIVQVGIHTSSRGSATEVRESTEGAFPGTIGVPSPKSADFENTGLDGKLPRCDATILHNLPTAGVAE